MKLSDLLKNHPAQALQSNSGDPVLRRAVWAPFFENLYENKLIYAEKFICLARIDALFIDDRGVGGIVVPLDYLHVPRGFPPPSEPWGFCGGWAHMTQGTGYLSQPYASWAVWPEAERVRAIEKLLSRGDPEGALEILDGP
jgi:hypothetical protein